MTEITINNNKYIIYGKCKVVGCPCIVKSETNSKPIGNIRQDILRAYLESKGVKYSDEEFKKLSAHKLIKEIINNEDH